MVRELLADGIPVGFPERLVPLEIEPDRAGVHPHEFRYRSKGGFRCQDDPYIPLEILPIIVLQQAIARRWQSRGYTPVPRSGNVRFHWRFPVTSEMLSQAWMPGWRGEGRNCHCPKERDL